MNLTMKSFSFPFVLCTLAVFAAAAEWPQYHGANSNKKAQEALASGAWLKKTSSQLWKVETPLGFSSFSVSNGLAYTLVGRQDEDGLQREVCVALEVNSGREKWAVWLDRLDYGHSGGNAGASDNKGGDGPRSTPSISDGKVYVYDADMNLHCLDAKSGKLAWKVSVQKRHKGQPIKWENASAPLIEGNKVIVYGGGAGQAFLALEKTNGNVIWQSGSETITHATPVAATIHGVRQVIFFCVSGLVSVDASSGKELWRQKFRFAVSTAAAPIVAGDHVYCSAGYGVGAGLYRISKNGTKFASTEVWRKQNDLINHWSTPVYHDGHLYGMFSFKKFGKGPFQCVELKTGQVKWSKDGYGPGNVILAGENLIALSDTGELAVVAANPSAYKELGRRKVITGKCWSTPVISDGKVFARSTKEAVCLKVSGR
ncbi:MAG: alcohol dehydrogenase [Opitutales bacterium]|nr:alcohol dehydrogenase [Opitutales bacterium]